MKNIPRKILENISRGVIFKRRLPPKFRRVSMYVTPEASLCYWKAFFGKNWDDLFRFAEEYVHPGDTVFDVGANLGVFSICAAIQAGPKGKVIAIEPDPVTSSIIQKTKKINPGILDNLLVISAGISSRQGFSDLNIPERARACSHLAEAGGGAGIELMGAIRSKIRVPLTTLDAVAAEHGQPDVLKVDVDGAEHLVIEGSRRMFSGKKPRVLIEVHDRNRESLTNFFYSLGYRLYNFDDPSNDRPEKFKTTYSTLAIPHP